MSESEIRMENTQQVRAPAFPNTHMGHRRLICDDRPDPWMLGLEAGVGSQGNASWGKMMKGFFLLTVMVVTQVMHLPKLNEFTLSGFTL